MAEVLQTQLVVLGAGPGGYASAFLAADKGMKVAMVDPRERPGGTCLHVGCIPSKALLHTAKLITDARDAEHAGLKFGPPQIDLAAVRGSATKVIDKLTGGLIHLGKERKVTTYASKGRFVDANTIALDDGRQLRFEHCIIATGSSPFIPGPLQINSPRVMDSTGALKLEDIPQKLLIVGGGYIGLEMGYVYAALGSKVTVVEFTDGLLPGVDRDLVVPLARRLTTLFDKIYLKTKVAGLKEAPGGVRAILEGAEVTEKEPLFNRVLIAVGRRPNTGDLGLDKAGVKLDDQGFIVVDPQRRTSSSKIFAIGDVAGQPMLAHKASYEGKIAVEAIAGEKVIYDVRGVPAVVFTDPEIAWCGLTEIDAEKQKREIKRVRFPWAGSGRALTLGRTEGLTKLIVDPTTDRVLGVGIVGPGAGEMIAEGMLALEMSATAHDIGLTMHAHPTLSETLGEAAESVYGMATHMLSKR